MRWFVRFNLPSGLQLAASEKDGEFAMSAITEVGAHHVLTWGTRLEAEDWCAMMMEHPVGKEIFEKFRFEIAQGMEEQ